jgi:hypothetical protein
MHRSISIRSMLAVVPGVSNFIQTRVGHSARSFREGAPRSERQRRYSEIGERLLEGHRSRASRFRRPVRSGRMADGC